MPPRRQFLNDPGTIVAQALEGLERANPGIVRWNREPSFVIRADDDARPRVAVISGGGSGHEPLHTGFVGRGMLDAAVPGGIFASPSMVQIAAATFAADRGRGVVHVVKNYTGDIINFGLARDEAIDEGIAVETVIVADDLATDADTDGPGRRGTAAVIAVEKICGAAAERGESLERVAALGREVAEGSRSLADRARGRHASRSRRSLVRARRGRDRVRRRDPRRARDRAPPVRERARARRGCSWRRSPARSSWSAATA